MCVCYEEGGIISNLLSLDVFALLAVLYQTSYHRRCSVKTIVENVYVLTLRYRLASFRQM